MEGSGGFGFGSTKPVTRKRTSTPRRPQSDFRILKDCIQWPGHSVQSSNNSDKLTSRKEDHSVQGVKVPNVASVNKLSKVKLKLGGVTRTINAKPDIEGGSLGSVTSMQASGVTKHRQQRMYQAVDDSVGKVGEENSAVFLGTVRKSKRMPKRRVLDSAFDDHGIKDKANGLETASFSKLPINCTQVSGDDKEEGRAKKLRFSSNSKSRKISYSVDEDYGLSSRSGNEKKSKSACWREHNGTQYAENEEHYIYPPEDSITINQKSVSNDSTVSTGEHHATRRRTIQTDKDAPSLSLIEFPNGLPPAPSRRQKDKLSEEEQQAKRAAAAMRRKMQMEKAARESEARAIRKIRGVDSDKKKAEKQRVDSEKMKAKHANSQLTSACTVRLVMGPSGTVVTFPEGVDLPSIFFSKPCSYPPPRETCAGPSCTNSYKYRDSRSNLPLCSLQCYRAVQGNVPPLTTC